MKTLTRLFGAGLLGLSLTGCWVTRKGVFEDYPIQYSEGINGGTDNYPNLMIFSKEEDEGYIQFTDNNFDGRYDMMELKDIRNGNPIERFASLEIGQRIAESFKEVEKE